MNEIKINIDCLYNNILETIKIIEESPSKLSDKFLYYKSIILNRLKEKDIFIENIVEEYTDQKIIKSLRDEQTKLNYKIKEYNIVEKYIDDMLLFKLKMLNFYNNQKNILCNIIYFIEKNKDTKVIKELKNMIKLIEYIEHDNNIHIYDVIEKHMQLMNMFFKKEELTINNIHQ